MKKQRTLFWGKVPGKTPKKDGSNLPVSRRRFRAASTGEMEIRFTNTTATQFGGYPLWDSFVGRVGLNAKLAWHIKMNRGEGFTAPELSRFFIDTRILGARRLQDVDRMRWDPMLTRTFGLDGLPSDETVGRYFKSFTRGHLESLDRLNTSLNNQLWKKSRKTRCGKAKKGKIILDYDSSTFTVYGKQEGADRGRSFRKKDKGGFQPKFAFIGGLGVMVNQELYPQSYNLPKKFEDFHKATLSKLPKTAFVWAIRGDGALYSEERIEWLEKKHTYSISAAMHAPLQKAVHAIPESEWIEDVDADGHRYSIARIRHCPKTWKKARTYIISRRLKDLKGQKVLWEWEKYKYFAYVTNYKGIPLEQFKFGVERCSLENFIKEGKSGFHYDFLPHQELDANRAYLGHVQMAYNLSIWWKILDAARSIKRWTIQTLRDRILNICGNLRKYQGRWVLSLPKWWPWKSIYQQLAQAGSFTFT
ncbi:IS1380 family transposase [Planctomycetota bacterium]